MKMQKAPNRGKPACLPIGHAGFEDPSVFAKPEYQRGETLTNALSTILRLAHNGL
jgi:hypothetical protein